MGKFSGSFLLTHYVQAASFLVSESGRSLKNATEVSLAKLCLESAMMFNHYLSNNQGNAGLAFSALISKAAPDLRKTEISFPVIFAAVS